MSIECPYCEEEHLDPVSVCSCGYRFSGYKEPVTADEEDPAEGEGRRNRRLVGVGMMVLGSALTAGSCLIMSQGGGGGGILFTGLIFVGGTLYFRNR